MRPLGIINLDLDELCAAAGGDPWAIDDQLQARDAGAINDLATALHRAPGNADDPITDSAEVARAGAALTGHRQDLNRLAVESWRRSPRRWRSPSRPATT